MTSLRIENLPAAEYHAKPHLSKGGMVELLKSPAHYKAWLAAKNEPTASMEFGTMVHTYVLEPDSFGAAYTVLADDIDFRTKDGKAAKAYAEQSGKKIVREADYRRLRGISESIRWSAPKEMFDDNAVTELSVFTETPIPMKARPDRVVGNTIFDLKTTTDASERGFMRAVKNYGYHLQAAHYMEMVGADQFIFVAVETEAPYGVGVYWLDDAWIAEGRRLRDRAIQIYSECSVVDAWPGYPAGPKKLSMPAWAVDSTNED